MHKRTSGEGFTRKEKAIAALLAKGNVGEAARVTGIGTQTPCRRLKDQEFDAAYRAAQRASCGQAMVHLQQGSRAAAATLRGIMLDSGAPPSTRLKAARFVLGLATDANWNGAR
jgi:hypothetical protein